MANGIDGGIDGGSSSFGIPAPPPPAGPSSVFALLVEQMDRAAQANLGAVAVSYQPVGGDPVTLSGIFDAQYVLVRGSAMAGVESTAPAVFLRVSDLPADPDDDDPTVSVGGTSYRVAERRPDGIGGIVLVLLLVVP